MHESPPHAVDDRDLIDLLIAISVVSGTWHGSSK